MPKDSIQPDMRAAYAWAAATGDAHTPLFQAAAEERISLVILPWPFMAWPKAALASVRLPTVVLVADDPEPQNSPAGPGEWISARQLRKWTRNAIVYGAAGRPLVYALAVECALGAGRCTVVETGSGFVHSWARFLDCPTTLRIAPPVWQAHPSRPRAQ